MSSLCLIIVTLAKVATLARQAFRIKRNLKPRVYPCSRIYEASEEERPNSAGNLRCDGLSTIPDINGEERPRDFMEVVRVLFLKMITLVSFWKIIERLNLHYCRPYGKR